MYFVIIDNLHNIILDSLYFFLFFFTLLSNNSKSLNFIFTLATNSLTLNLNVDYFQNLIMHYKNIRCFLECL